MIPDQPLQHFLDQGIPKFQVYFGSRFEIFELDNVFHANGKRNNKANALKRKKELQESGFKVRLDLRLQTWYFVFKRDKKKEELTILEKMFYNRKRSFLSMLFPGKFQLEKVFLEMEENDWYMVTIDLSPFPDANHLHFYKDEPFKSTIALSDITIEGTTKTRVNSTALKFSFEGIKNKLKEIKIKWRS